MRVLLVANIILPEIAHLIGINPTPFGGWLSLSTRALAESGANVSVGVAMRSPTKQFKKFHLNDIDFYVLPQRRIDRFDVHQSDVSQVINEFKPDILHVEGTEMRHALRFLNAWPGPRVISLQGILNGIAPYELGFLPLIKWLFAGPLQLRPMAAAMLVRHSIFFVPRLKVERQSLLKATDVIGRTIWDEAHARKLNSNIFYHQVGRTLREEFSQIRWDKNNHYRYSLFFGNGAVPLKGLHFVLKGIALLRREFPNVSLFVAGQNPYKVSLFSLKRYFGYSAYIRFLIKKLALENNVEFCGILSGKEICKRMSNCNAFVLGSLIENESATLGEAMMIGLPSVVTYAGGVPSMATDEKEVLFYRAEDTAMLAHQLRRVFTYPSLCEKLSEASRARAQRNYDGETNLRRLISVYNTVLERK